MANIRYFQVWVGAVKEFDLTPIQGNVISLIYGLSKADGWCRASKQTLADALNVSEPAIYRAIEALEAKDLIEFGEKYGRGITRMAPTGEWVGSVEREKRNIGKEKMGWSTD